MWLGLDREGDSLSDEDTPRAAHRLLPDDTAVRHADDRARRNGVGGPPSRSADDYGRPALTFTPAAPSDSTRTLDANFTLGVTDATGSKAGWHIQAAFGRLVGGDGTPEPILAATVAEARVTTLTGIAPHGTLAYPHPFQPAGDTIFSAAAASGVGKCTLAFATTVRLPTDMSDTAPRAGTLTLTIAAGP